MAINSAKKVLIEITWKTSLFVQGSWKGQASRGRVVDHIAKYHGKYGYIQNIFNNRKLARSPNREGPQENENHYPDVR